MESEEVFNISDLMNFNYHTMKIKIVMQQMYNYAHLQNRIIIKWFQDKDVEMERKISSTRLMILNCELESLKIVTDGGRIDEIIRQLEFSNLGLVAMKYTHVRLLLEKNNCIILFREIKNFYSTLDDLKIQLNGAAQLNRYIKPIKGMIGIIERKLPKNSLKVERLNRLIINLRKLNDQMIPNLECRKEDEDKPYRYFVSSKLSEESCKSIFDRELVLIGEIVKLFS